jgi:hypothetical protein
MSNITASLIQLRRQYESIAAHYKYQAAQAKAQIEHINALLLDSIVHSRMPRLSRELDSELPFTVVTPSLAPAEIAPVEVLSQESTPSVADKITDPEQQESVAGAIFGAKTMRRAQSQDSLTLLPEYAGMTKLEAITKALSRQPGQTLHQNTIIQLLYGELTAAQMSLESRRMRASLFQGVKRNLWQRSSEQPSSYLIEDKTSLHTAQSKSPPGGSAVAETSTSVKAVAKKSVGSTAAVSSAKLIKLKPGRPPRVSALSKKAKNALQSAQPMPRQLEVVALLRKPSFSI